MCKPPPGAFTPRMPAGGTFPSPCIRNASSTASMHSGKVSSCSTSLRRSSKVPSVFIRRADQARDLVAGYGFDRAFSAAKNPGAVGTADENCVRTGHGFSRIIRAVGGVQLVTHRGKARPGFRRIAVAVVQSVRKKQNPARWAEDIPDRFLDVVEIAAAVEGGVAHQENMQVHCYRYNTKI